MKGDINKLERSTLNIYINVLEEKKKNVYYSDIHHMLECIMNMGRSHNSTSCKLDPV